MHTSKVKLFSNLKEKWEVDYYTSDLKLDIGPCRDHEFLSERLHMQYVYVCVIDTTMYQYDIGHSVMSLFFAECLF